VACPTSQIEVEVEGEGEVREFYHTTILKWICGSGELVEEQGKLQSANGVSE